MKEESLPVKTRILNQARRLLMLPPLENLVARMVSGRNVTHVLARIAPNHYQYEKPSLRLAVRHGLNFELDLSDLMDWSLFYDFTESSHERLFSLCRPGATVMDIGTNIGAVLLRMAQSVGPTGQAYGFEPNPAIFHRCRKNLELNKLKNVHLSPGDIITTLDDFAGKQIFERLDVVKIDVEGFEKNVLLGGARLIRRYRPILFMELSDVNLKRHNTSGKELLALLRSWHYRIVAAETGALLPAGFEATGVHMDIIGYPEAKTE